MKIANELEMLDLSIIKKLFERKSQFLVKKTMTQIEKVIQNNPKTTITEAFNISVPFYIKPLAEAYGENYIMKVTLEAVKAADHTNKVILRELLALWGLSALHASSSVLYEGRILDSKTIEMMPDIILKLYRYSPCSSSSF